MNIRPATVGDAKALILFYQQLDQESTFMLFEPGERDVSIETQEKQLSGYAASNSDALYLAEADDNKIIGFVSGNGGKALRNKHSLYCVIGILSDYQGQGIGRALLEMLELWATRNSYHRMELTVTEHNHRAIRLYENLGFEREGIKRDALKISGIFLNQFYMSKLLKMPNP